MNVLKNKLTASLQKRIREKRNVFFMSLIQPISKPISILDIGGTVKFWQDSGLLNLEDIDITLVNLKFPSHTDLPLKCIVGDSRNLSMFRDYEFDVVFSNSVIEHVGGFDDQLKMANEIKRVGSAYFVQTPNFYFPVEPHYRALGFQFLPFNLKVFLLKNVGVGQCKRTKNKKSALKEARRIKLLTLKKLKRLFPQSTVYKERFLGITKSLIVYNGFNPD